MWGKAKVEFGRRKWTETGNGAFSLCLSEELIELTWIRYSVLLPRRYKLLRADRSKTLSRTFLPLFLAALPMTIVGICAGMTAEAKPRVMLSSYASTAKTAGMEQSRSEALPIGNSLNPLLEFNSSDHQLTSGNQCESSPGDATSRLLGLNWHRVSSLYQSEQNQRVSESIDSNPDSSVDHRRCIHCIVCEAERAAGDPVQSCPRLVCLLRTDRTKPSVGGLREWYGDCDW